MNTQALMNHIHYAILHRPAGPAATYHICFYDGRVACLPTKHTTTPHPIFYRPHAADLTKGFTGPQWSLIASRIDKYLTESKQCLKPLKP